MTVLTRGQVVADVAILGGCSLIVLLTARAMTSVTIRALRYVTRWAVAFAVIHAIVALLRENQLYLFARDSVATGLDAVIPASDMNRAWDFVERSLMHASGSVSRMFMPNNEFFKSDL